MSNNLDEKTKLRFQSALASDTLKELCYQMKADGLSQVVIHHLFSEFFKSLAEPKSDADTEALGDALDGIVGFCSPASRWFDHYLSNEEINSFQSGIPEKEVQQIYDLIKKDDASAVSLDFGTESNGEVTVKTMTIRKGAIHETYLLTFRKVANVWQLSDKNLQPAIK